MSVVVVGARAATVLEQGAAPLERPVGPVGHLANPHLVNSGGPGFPAAPHLRFHQHLQDQVRAEEQRVHKMEVNAERERADAIHLHKLEHEVKGLKPAWAVPEDPTKDRLNSESCKEPKPYKKTDYAGAFGPDKIFCCHTVRQVIEDVKYRCEVECNDAHPCHTSMKEIYCPKYLKAYQKMEAVLCRERPTTTTTTTTVTTTTTTIPFCLEGEVSPVYPCRCGDDLCEEGEICEDGVCKAIDGKKDDDKDALDKQLAWCYEVCETEMAKELGDLKCDEVDLGVVEKYEKGCKGTCRKLHSMGALRPVESHADHAKELESKE